MPINSEIFSMVTLTQKFCTIVGTIKIFSTIFFFLRKIPYKINCCLNIRLLTYAIKPLARENKREYRDKFVKFEFSIA